MSRQVEDEIRSELAVMAGEAPTSAGLAAAAVSRAHRQRRRNRIGGTIAAAVAVVVLAGASSRGLWQPDTVTQHPAAGSGSTTSSSASCVEAFSLENLKQRSFAVDGTVISVSGDIATVQVNKWFRGTPPASAEGNALTMDVSALAETGDTSSVTDADLHRGVRILFSGEPAASRGSPLLAWGCGFTRPYSATEATRWGQALRS